MLKRKLYVGIDVHAKEHKAAIIPVKLFEEPNTPWKELIPLNIKNQYESFEYLNTAIQAEIDDPSEVVIAVDHTGGHYSEPIVFYLISKGYDVYYLETKGIKAARERLLDEECKSDVIDSISTAYLLYLRDTQGLSFRISLMRYELGSKAALLNSLVLQRWQFNKLIGQTTNRLHQILIATFPEGEAKYFNKLLKVLPYYPTPQEIQNSNGLNDIRRLKEKDREGIARLAIKSVGVPGNNYAWLVKELSSLRIDLLERRNTITSMLREQLSTHPYSEILYSFPQLGEVAAATLIGIIKNIDNWPNKKKLKKAFGVYSISTQSGNTYRTKQGKEGSRHGRRVLFLICLGCISRTAPENDFRDFYLKQVSHGKIKMKALVSTMGKLAEIIYHCLKNREPYKYRGIYRIN